jgi:hypothetical protein
MSQVGSITIMAPGEMADALLACLRDKVAELYKVVIAEPDSNHVHVTDQSSGIDDLPAFLDVHLDECAQMLGVPNRRAHLLVDRPGSKR